MISMRLDEASGAISVKLGAFSYLTAWRMHVAAALLLDGTSDIGIVASRVGYRSEA
jgi:AraC-like DNA-binding protein